MRTVSRKQAVDSGICDAKDLHPLPETATNAKIGLSGFGGRSIHDIDKDLTLHEYTTRYHTLMKVNGNKANPSPKSRLLR